MDQNVIYVGIDADVRYHGSALDKRTGEVLDFHCRPTLKGLVEAVKELSLARIVRRQSFLSVTTIRSFGSSCSILYARLSALAD